MWYSWLSCNGLKDCRVSVASIFAGSAYFKLQDPGGSHNLYSCRTICKVSDWKKYTLIDWLILWALIQHTFSHLRLWASSLTTLITWSNSWWFDVILILTINCSTGLLVVTTPWRYAMSSQISWCHLTCIIKGELMIWRKTHSWMIIYIIPY